MWTMPSSISEEVYRAYQAALSLRVDMDTVSADATQKANGEKARGDRLSMFHARAHTQVHVHAGNMTCSLALPEPQLTHADSSALTRAFSGSAGTSWALEMKSERQRSFWDQSYLIGVARQVELPPSLLPHLPPLHYSLA